MRSMIIFALVAFLAISFATARPVEDEIEDELELDLDEEPIDIDDDAEEVDDDSEDESNDEDEDEDDNEEVENAKKPLVQPRPLVFRPQILPRPRFNEAHVFRIAV